MMPGLARKVDYLRKALAAAACPARLGRHPGRTTKKPKNKVFFLAFRILRYCIYPAHKCQNVNNRLLAF